MKKLIASMFGLSLLALFLLSGDSRTIGADDAGLQSFAKCSECEKDGSGDKDGSEKKSRLLAEEHEDEDEDHEHDGSDKKSSLLAEEHEDEDDHDDHDHDGSDKKESRLFA